MLSNNPSFHCRNDRKSLISNETRPKNSLRPGNDPRQDSSKLVISPLSWHARAANRTSDCALLQTHVSHRSERNKKGTYIGRGGKSRIIFLYAPTQPSRSAGCVEAVPRTGRGGCRQSRRGDAAAGTMEYGNRHVHESIRRRWALSAIPSPTCEARCRQQ